MRVMIRRVFICLLAVGVFYLGGIAAERNMLSRNLIRFHVMANSDSEADQEIKLRVRDAVLDNLRPALQDAADVQSAREYLKSHLEEIRQTADKVLEALGCTDRTAVSLSWERFCTRKAEELSLPAGLYNMLKITIGSGEGRNWWGVLFPVYGGTQWNDTITVSASETVAGKKGTEIRFFFFKMLGALENYLH